MTKIVFFDCDETLWVSDNKDWVGSQSGPIKKIDNNSIIRKSDGKVFTLKKGIRDILLKLVDQGYKLGIVSDNIEESVLEALKEFDILKYFDMELINIKLRKGYCPKNEMIDEVLTNYKQTYDPSDVWLVDDKDYKVVIESKGYNFIQATNESLLEDCQSLTHIYS